MSKSVIKCCLLLGLLGALNSQARATHLIFQKTSLDTAPDSLIDMYFNRPTTYQGNIFGFYVETLARDGQDHLGQVIDFHFTKLGGDGLLQDRRMQFDAIGSGSPTILRFNSGFQGRTWQGLVKVDILSTTDDDFITPDTQQE